MYKYTPEERLIIDKMLSWQVCAACQCGCMYLQPAHVKTVGSGGKHKHNVLPFCPNCHDAQHKMGIITFQAQMKIDMSSLAITIWNTAEEAVRV